MEKWWKDDKMPKKIVSNKIANQLFQELVVLHTPTVFSRSWTSLAQYQQRNFKEMGLPFFAEHSYIKEIMISK